MPRSTLCVRMDAEGYSRGREAEGKGPRIDPIKRALGDDMDIGQVHQFQWGAWPRAHPEAAAAITAGFAQAA